MSPILDQVKSNALRFYSDVEESITAKAKNVDHLRVRVIAFRDLEENGPEALNESSFYFLPDDQGGFADFLNGLSPTGGGDAPESGWRRWAWPSTQTG